MIGQTTTACTLCGRSGLALVESRPVRRGISRLRAASDEGARLYERCDGCGARHLVELAA